MSPPLIAHLVILFAYTGPASWNSLPNCLKNVNFTLRTFKRHLKTFFSGTSAGFWLGGQSPLAAWGEENFENLTTKWCILKYI